MPSIPICTAAAVGLLLQVLPGSLALTSDDVALALGAQASPQDSSVGGGASSQQALVQLIGGTTPHPHSTLRFRHVLQENPQRYFDRADVAPRVVPPWIHQPAVVDRGVIRPSVDPVVRPVIRPVIQLSL